jgi:hypothetical protein
MVQHCEECGDRIESGAKLYRVRDAVMCSPECKAEHKAFLKEQEQESDAYESDEPRARQPAYVLR